MLFKKKYSKLLSGIYHILAFIYFNKKNIIPLKIRRGRSCSW